MLAGELGFRPMRRARAVLEQSAEERLDPFIEIGLAARLKRRDEAAVGLAQGFEDKEKPDDQEPDRATRADHGISLQGQRYYPSEGCHAEPGNDAHAPVEAALPKARSISLGREVRVLVKHEPVPPSWRKALRSHTAGKEDVKLCRGGGSGRIGMGLLPIKPTGARRAGKSREE